MSDKKRIPRWLRLIRIIAITYAMFALFACTLADKLIFFPPRPGYSTQAPNLVHFQTSKDESIAALYYPAQAGQPTVLYSHGNAEDIAGSISLYQEWRRDGWGVLAYDYPGYGLSGGSPTARSSERSIEAAWQFLTATHGIDSGEILVIGSSVGGGPSTSLLKSHRPAGLVLISPFTSAFEVRPPAQYLVPGNRFHNLKRIKNSDVPLLVIHGENDRIIPASHGRAIIDASPAKPKRLLIVSDAGHNDLFYQAELEIFIAIRDFAAEIGLGNQR